MMGGTLPDGADAMGDARLATDVPHPARVYNYWLGGKDHFLADRAAAEQVIQVRPQVVEGARANRAFLARMVRYLAADCEIRQFLDIGTGLPAPDNTHEVAQRVAPDCRVVYCDNDPLVLTHARALLVGSPAGACAYVDADVRDTATILGETAQTLDLTQPVAVLLLAILHFLPDSDDPAKVVAALTDALPPGSFVAISHLTADLAPEQVRAAAQAYNTRATVPVTPRTHAQVTALFGGLPLVPPGVVRVTEWRPGLHGSAARPVDLYGGLARASGARR